MPLNGTQQLQTSVVIFVFNRPEHTKEVFQKVAEVKPSRLYIVADGPRNEAEVNQCQAVREVVATVDWDCDIHRNYADENMGLKARISSGLNWVFEQEETAIILEDDCVPDMSFFRFCEELLDYYRDNERIMHISGDNWGYTQPVDEEASYYFSKYAHVWGWATWRRAWRHFDLNMTFWDKPDTRELILKGFPNPKLRRYWENILERTYQGEIKTWDYSWMATCLYHHGLCVMPYKNLVSNIGFGAASTHTADTESIFANRPTEAISFPLCHPTSLRPSIDGDTLTESILLRKRTLYERILKRIQRIFNR